MSRRRWDPAAGWPAWLGLAVAAFTIRCHGLAARSYWLDEILEVLTIRSPWVSMWRGLQAGVYNAPLDYVTRKGFEAFGPTEGARRLVGVVWGTTSVVFFGLLIARRSERRTGLIAAALLAVSPYHVRYSQEVRPYALSMLLICLDLWALDRYLERPSRSRLTVFLVTSLAAAYTSYLAALIILIASTTMLVSDAARSADRGKNVRGFVRLTPVLLAGFAVAYAPWWPVLVGAFRAPGLSTRPPLRWERVTRIASFYGFGERDWQPLGLSGALFVGLVILGVVIALRDRRLRFLAAWGLVGIAAVELLEQRHPVYDSVFHELPAGMALTGIAALSLAWVLRRRRIPGAILLVLTLALAIRGVGGDFAHGRPDWRPISAFLRATPRNEPILAGSQYTQLCLGFYVNGPDWLLRLDTSRSVTIASDRDGRPAWDGRTTAWLVEAGGANPSVWPAWSNGFPTLVFPDAEGENGVGVRHLIAGSPSR